MFSLPYLFVCALAIHVLSKFIWSIVVPCRDKNNQNQLGAADRRVKKRVDRIAFVCAIALYFVVSIKFNIVDIYYYHEPYTTSSWVSSGAEERGRMIDSFVQQHDLVGMKRAEVEEFLGSPDESFSNYYIYDLGHMGERPVFEFIFPYKLKIRFEKDKNVVSNFYIDD